MKSSQYILNNININIKVGDRIGIIGETEVEKVH